MKCCITSKGAVNLWRSLDLVLIPGGPVFFTKDFRFKIILDSKSVILLKQIIDLSKTWPYLQCLAPIFCVPNHSSSVVEINCVFTEVVHCTSVLYCTIVWYFILLEYILISHCSVIHRQILKSECFLIHCIYLLTLFYKVKM